jgi:tetrahydromethanopterin S-methyltransferase subunit B
MSTYSLRAAEVVKEYGNAKYKMIDVTITFEDGAFASGALSHRVTATDGSTTARSLMASLSPNGKEIHAFFTTDAFAAMSGPIRFEFFYGFPLGAIENVNMAAILQQLPPFLAALGVPDADNNWMINL